MVDLTKAVIFTHTTVNAAGTTDTFPFTSLVLGLRKKPQTKKSQNLDKYNLNCTATTDNMRENMCFTLSAY